MQSAVWFGAWCQRWYHSKCLVSTAATGSRCFGDITRDPVMMDCHGVVYFFFGGGVFVVVGVL